MRSDYYRSIEKSIENDENGIQGYAKQAERDVIRSEDIPTIDKNTGRATARHASRWRSSWAAFASRSVSFALCIEPGTCFDVTFSEYATAA